MHIQDYEGMIGLNKTKITFGFLKERIQVFDT